MKPGFERQRSIIGFTVRSLARRGGKLLSLIILFGTIVFVLATILFSTQALRREARLLLTDAPELTVQRMLAGRHEPIPLAYAATISAIRGVADVQPRLWGYYFDPATGENLTLQATTDTTLLPGTVRIGTGLARSRKLLPGGNLLFSGPDGMSRTFLVSRIQYAGSSLRDAQQVMLTLQDFRTLFNFPTDQATDLAITVRNPREIPTVAARIAEQFPDSRPITRDDLQRTYTAVFNWRGGILVVIVSLAVTAFLIFAWDRASGLSARERQEIGILKSIGWATEDVLFLKLWEGAAISLTAFLLGLTAAYLQVFHFSAPLFATVLRGWTTLYPRFQLTPEIDFYQIAILYVLTAFPYLVATIVPSWRAAIIDPDTAMRG